MSIEIGQIYPYFFEKDKSRALFNAQIWIGDADTDPEFNLKVVVGVQENGAEVALNQPLTTNSGGGFTYNGSPILVKVDPPYSMKVLNSKGAQEYYWPYINPVGGAPSIGSTVQETQTLASDQTTVTLSTQLNGYISVKVNGDFIDDSVLVSGVDYTQINQTEIELTDSYPAGTLITVTQNDLSGDSKGPINCYETVNAAESANLEVGTCFKIQENGGSEYIVRNTDYNLLPGDITIGNSLPAELQHLDDNSWNVLAFGAFNDVDDGPIIQSEFFELAAQRANNGSVFVPTGRYRITDVVPTSANWAIADNVQFTGVATIPPTGQRDLTNLTGRVEFNLSSDGFGYKYFGDNSFTVQKATNRSQTSGAVNGASNTGQNGVSGYSNTDAKDTADSGCIGVKAVTVVDNESVEIGAWGLYAEIVKTENSQGNALATEAAIVNKSPNAFDFTPATRIIDSGGQLCASIWASTGINEADDTDSSCMIGGITVGISKYKRGIVIKHDSLSTEEAICISKNEQLCWYDSPTYQGGTGVRLNYITGGTGSTFPGRIDMGVRNLANVDFHHWYFSTQAMFFSEDNFADIGRTGERIKSIYLQNAPDVVSDETKKMEIRQLTADELNAGLSLSRNVQSFKWVAEVSEKGIEASYEHISVMAQQTWQILIDNNLDPTNYGFISNSDEGWSIMPTEILMLINAAIVDRQDKLEERLIALEAN